MREGEMKTSLLQGHSNYIRLLAETDSAVQRQALLTTIRRPELFMPRIFIFNFKNEVVEYEGSKLLRKMDIINESHAFVWY